MILFTGLVTCVLFLCFKGPSSGIGGIKSKNLVKRKHHSGFGSVIPPIINADNSIISPSITSTCFPMVDNNNIFDVQINVQILSSNNYKFPRLASYRLITLKKTKIQMIVKRENSMSI